MPALVLVFPDRNSQPVQRGQGNLPYRSEEKNRVLHRGQESPYNINGAPTGGVLADGDYGDIVVSGSGASMELDPAVVTAFARTILDDADAAAVRATIDFNEAVDDRVAALIVAGTNITTTYDDAANTLTIDAAAGGADPWTYVKLAADFTTNSASAVDVTGFNFTPVANTSYEIEGRIRLRTAASATAALLGLSWPTGLDDGGAILEVANGASALNIKNVHINASGLTNAGTFNNTSQSHLGRITAEMSAGATPSGNLQVQLASETAGTNVTMKAGSFIRYRTI